VRIGWAIPCRGVDTPADEMPNILGTGMNIFRVAEFPSQLQVVVALNVLAREDELGHPQQLECQVLGPDMQPAGEPLSTALMIEATPAKPPGWEQNAIIPVVMVFEAQQEGTHTVQFTIEGRNQPPVALYVTGPDQA
jgi:hypothetical protein